MADKEAVRLAERIVRGAFGNLIGVSRSVAAMLPRRATLTSLIVPFQQGCRPCSAQQRTTEPARDLSLHQAQITVRAGSPHCPDPTQPGMAQ